MKLSYLAICSIVLFSQVTSASKGPCNGDVQPAKYRAHFSDSYLRLASMFDDGTSFDFDGAIGWYSGRCWRAYSETAQNGLLVLESRETDGPNFPPVKKFAFYQWQDRPENVFETPGALNHEGHSHRGMSKQKLAMHTWPNMIARNFQNDWKDISAISEAEGGGYVSTYAHLAPMILRKSADDKYFVLKRSDTLICYFFDPVEAETYNR